MKKKWIVVISLIIVCCLGIGFTSYFKQTDSKQVATKSKPVSKETPIIEEKIGPFSKADRQILFDLVHQTIQDGLDGKAISYPDLNMYPKKWSDKRVVYTTLNIGKNLRGCRGNLGKPKPFLHALVDSAHDAAFQDSRFSKLTQKEFDSPDFNAYITILETPKPLTFKDEKDLIKKIVPFKYGMILEYISGKDKKRGLFLPSVWKKRPDASNFWEGLKKKAKLKKDFFSDKIKVSYFSSENIRDPRAIQRQDSQRIQSALSAFKKLFQSDGHVQYEVKFISDKKTNKSNKKSTKSNIVREMGSGFGLAYAYYMTHDSESKPLLKKFFKNVRQSAKPFENGLLVADDKGNIKSGASALALLAVLYYEQESQDKSVADLREGLKNALVHLFDPKVGVYTSPDNPKSSPYYDGEAWLALATYHTFYPDNKELADTLSQMNQMMYKKYADKYLYNFFHWGSQAAAKQYAFNQDPLMYDFLKKQVDLYMKSTQITPVFATCSYAEGLGEAALAFKGRDEAYYYKTLERLEDQLDVPRLLQTPNKAISEKTASDSTKSFIGLFLNKHNAKTTRNDITQHCLSALLKAQKIYEEMP